MRDNHRSTPYREPGKVIDRLITGLWEAIDELENLQPAETRFFRVAIFGSARIRAGDPAHDLVRRFARQVGALGCDIVTGGGPGLMAAANEGAHEAFVADGVRIRSYGLTIDLLSAGEATNPFVDHVTAHRTFFSRLHHFVRMSHAYAVFPGGIGTSLETFMIWQLLQVGHIPNRPLIFVGRMYRGLLEWMRSEMVPANLLAPRELGLAAVVDEDELEEAVAIIADAKKRFDAAKAEAVAKEEGAGTGNSDHL